MICDRVGSIHKHRPFDLLIRNVRIVNIYTHEVSPGSIAIVGDRIVLCGALEEEYEAHIVIDGEGKYALPGFIDSHMHLESSMLTPQEFSRIALSHGTTTVCADPHEIGNVLGYAGVKALQQACNDLPLHVLMMAPSTVPSAPGFEGSGYDVSASEAEQFLSDPAIAGLGEVMDFRGVANGEERICSVLDVAEAHGCLIDGHASLLTGSDLSAFRAAGIDSDHTLPTAAKLREELSLGFTVQVQDCMLHSELVKAMNEAPVFDRICLVTDDVSLDRLMTLGHLNHVVAHAIDLGLDPLRAIRFATLNPAVRLREFRRGGIAPGMIADLQLVSDLRAPRADLVIVGGTIVYQRGTPVHVSSASHSFPPLVYHTVNLPRRPTPEDFRLTLPFPASALSGTVIANVIGCDGVSIRTKRERCILPVRIGKDRPEADPGELLRMAVFNRYGLDRRALALISGFPDFHGAIALTYGHDCHNLTVYGSSETDMALSANAVCDAGGGIAFAKNGTVQALVALPVAGLISELPAEDLHAALRDLLSACRASGLCHTNPMAFLTLMPLAVSPDIKCSDMGLVDVTRKAFLPLFELPEVQAT